MTISTQAASACLTRTVQAPEEDTALNGSECLVTGVFWSTSHLIVTWLHHGIRYLRLYKSWPTTHIIRDVVQVLRDPQVDERTNDHDRWPRVSSNLGSLPFAELV